MSEHKCEVWRNGYCVVCTMQINKYIERLQEQILRWETWHYWRKGSPPELSDIPPEDKA